MSKKEDQLSGLPEWPNNKPEFWFACAISLGLIGLCIAPFAINWAFQGVDETAVKDRMAIIAPIATLFLAVITFFTVAWRGMVTSVQAEQQRRQNDAKDDENLAKLLIDGTKLVSSKDTQSAEVVAGVAALHSIVTSDRDRYGNAAMGVLATLINEVVKMAKPHPILTIATAAINEGAVHGNVSSIDLDIVNKNEEKRFFPFLRGSNRIRYEHAIVFPIYFEKSGEEKAYRFRNCDLGFRNFNLNVAIYNCDVKNSTIESIQMSQIENNRFQNCNFSNAFIARLQPNGKHDYFKSFASGTNHFVKGHEPTGPGWPILREYLIERTVKVGVNEH